MTETNAEQTTKHLLNTSLTSRYTGLHHFVEFQYVKRISTWIASVLLRTKIFGKRITTAAEIDKNSSAKHRTNCSPQRFQVEVSKSTERTDRLLGEQKYELNANG